MLWDALDEQKTCVETIDLSHNHGRLEASTVSDTLASTFRLRKLNLANALKGHSPDALLSPWNSGLNASPWRLEELDISGWKVILGYSPTSRPVLTTGADQRRHFCHLV